MDDYPYHPPRQTIQPRMPTRLRSLLALWIVLLALAFARALWLPVLFFTR